MANTEEILLIGNSVRYLAQSARKRGHRVLAVDAFGDADTQSAADRTCRAPRVDAEALVHAMPEGLAGRAMSCVYAAGFEAEPGRLREVQRRGVRVLGNDPRVLQLQRDSERWFALLERLGIAVPEVARRRPARPRGWLFKRAGSAGGGGVEWADKATPAQAPGHYQEFVRGPLCSLLFAADGEDSEVIGFNRLFARYPAAGDFRFASVISGWSPGPEQRTCMQQAASRLTRELRLRGFNGLDFVLRDGEPLLLELNARPPASLELYEDDLAGGGFDCHIAACRGALPSLATPVGSRGLRVVHARRDLLLGDVAWPDWVRDRPAAGTRVARREALCTLHASGPDVATVESRLRESADTVHEMLNSFSEEAA